MKHTFNLCLLVLMLSTACTKEIEFKTEQVSSKLVLNCLLAADQPINVHLSQTVPLFADSIPFIENAMVELYENDSLVDVLVSMGKGMYTSSIFAREGYNYKIKASSPGFEEVTGEDYVPELVPIISATADYGLFLYNSQSEISYGIDFITSIHNTYVNPDPLFSTEDYFGYIPNQFLFSDSYFSGLQKEIRMKMEVAHYTQERTTSLWLLPEGINIVLRSVSKNYYLFFDPFSKFVHLIHIQNCMMPL